MYKRIKPLRTSININTSVEGESIEKKVERIMQNGEPIEDGAEIIYTDRKDGVAPEYNIRTDRFEIAVEATDTITKNKVAKREGTGKKPEAGAEQAPPDTQG